MVFLNGAFLPLDEAKVPVLGYKPLFWELKGDQVTAVPFDTHYNEVGHALVGTAIAKTLLAKGLFGDGLVGKGQVGKERVRATKPVAPASETAPDQP